MCDRRGRLPFAIPSSRRTTSAISSGAAGRASGSSPISTSTSVRLRPQSRPCQHCGLLVQLKAQSGVRAEPLCNLDRHTRAAGRIEQPRRVGHERREKMLHHLLVLLALMKSVVRWIPLKPVALGAKHSAPTRADECSLIGSAKVMTGPRNDACGRFDPDERMWVYLPAHVDEPVTDLRIPCNGRPEN